MQYPRKYRPKKCDEVSGSKDGKRKFHDVWKSKFLWLIYDSSNNIVLKFMINRTTSILKS
jgi:hypothetical protein